MAPKSTVVHYVVPLAYAIVTHQKARHFERFSRFAQRLIVLLAGSVRWRVRGRSLPYRFSLLIRYLGLPRFAVYVQKLPGEIGLVGDKATVHYTLRPPHL